MNKSLKHIGAVVTACLTIAAGVAIAQPSGSTGNTSPGTNSPGTSGSGTNSMGTSNPGMNSSGTNNMGTNSSGTSTGTGMDQSRTSGTTDTSGTMTDNDRMNADGSMRAARRDRN